MKTYKHLTQKERDQIATYRNRGWTFRDIGQKLGRNHTSLSREFKRNGHGKQYLPHTAQQKALKKRQNHKRMRLKKRTLRTLVESMIMQYWSPEIIAGRLRKKNKGHTVISHEAIYQWIYTEARHLIGYLTQARLKRKPRRFHRQKRSKIPDRTPLNQRPYAANTRQELGHIEADLVLGTGPAALNVSVDRKSRMTRMKKIPNKTAVASRKALQTIYQDLPQDLRKSITYDNGSENTEHQLLNQVLGTQSYFCAPYHSWEKPTVENTNGLIRRFWPKKTNFDTLSEQEIQDLQDWLNNSPRKCLDFLTPAEAQDLFLGALYD